jgi:protein phosphatase 1 regulatory subunit 7
MIISILNCYTFDKRTSLTDRSLDLSFNNIRHPPNLPSLKKVKVMYLVQNKIAKVEPGQLDWCADTITSIELGGNRIRVSTSFEVPSGVLTSAGD